MPEVLVQHRFHVASPRERLWPIITDTDLINRLSGMNEVHLEPVEGQGSARYLVRTNLDGFPVQYLEPPYEWTTPSWFQVHRDMQTGPTAWLRMRFELEDADEGGTDITLELRLLPKFLPLVPIARFLAKRRMATIADAIRGIDEELRRGTALSRPIPIEPTRFDPTELDRCARALRASAAGAPSRDKLLALVRDAHDAELIRIRPFELADRWDEDRNDVLDACLHGVEAGLLELNWDLVCPSCQTRASRVGRLWELDDAGHCQLCDIDFELPFDRSVEATFCPRPGVRPVEDIQFCSGGPARTPHVLSQHHLPAGAAIQLTAPEFAGPLRVFLRGGSQVDVRVVDDGAEQTQVIFPEGPAPVAVRPGGAILVTSALGDDRHVKLELPGWSDLAATASHLATNALFRRQFSGDVLAPGRQLKVTRISLLFSDLTGSTELYTREGDARAYKLVQEHFDLLGGIIAAHHGTIVKTIGDAVMAAFSVERDALACSVAMLEAWPAFQAPRETAQDVWLKLGVHSGPCYAVTANDLLDYFGQTVNVAARLQGAAGEDELVVLAELADEARAGDWLGRAEEAERFDAELKGLDGALGCSRLRIPR
ncbi:MAG: hypothetical protein GY913_18900 [Proteobacteria bacterium]|nr:hypothetical protein [Pseudomonadota bacterium]MCP4918980.1 hypothetical protein [Pseudomonadota bacterium]